MDFNISFNDGASRAAAPRYAPDLRPAADSAALATDPRPDIPLGPASGQPVRAAAGAASGSGGSPDDRAAGRDRVDRVLKPFGVQMLPATDRDRPSGRADQSTAQDQPGAGAGSMPADPEPVGADPASVALARVAD